MESGAHSDRTPTLPARLPDPLHGAGRCTRRLPGQPGRPRCSWPRNQAPCVAPGRGRPHTCGIQPLTGRSCREVGTAAQARAAQQTEPAAAGTAAGSDPVPQARRGVCGPARPLGNRRRRRCHCCIFPVGTRRPREAKRLSRGGWAAGEGAGSAAAPRGSRVRGAQAAHGETGAGGTDAATAGILSLE